MNEFFKKYGERHSPDSPGAAQLLGLNPSTLYTKMKKLGIPIQRTKDGIPS